MRRERKHINGVSIKKKEEVTSIKASRGKKVKV